MAVVYKQAGDIVEFTSPGGAVVVLVPLLIGSQLVIPLVTAAATKKFSGRITGVFKNAAKETGTEWTEGLKLYWDNGNSRFTHDATAGMHVGIAVLDAVSGASVGTVRLTGVTPTFIEGEQTAVVILTDSTGDSGTHDDTIADGLTAVAPAATTAWIAAVTDYTAVTDMTDPVAKAEGETFSAAMAVLENEVTAIADAAGVLENEVGALEAIIATLVTDVTTQNQNDSDLAQKIIELRGAMVAAGILA